MLQEGATTLRLQSLPLASQMTSCLKMWHLDSQRSRDVSTVPWPPHIDHLEEGEEVCELLLKLLTWLKQPGRKTVNLSPTTLSLASMITYYVTGQRTTTAINLGSNLHGMTRSKDLVETLHKSDVCIRPMLCSFMITGLWRMWICQEPAHWR